MASFRLLLIFVILICSRHSLLFAQTTDSSKVEEEDYSNYGSAEDAKKYCTQKVRLLSPTKLVSAGFEWQNRGSYLSGRPIGEITDMEVRAPEKFRSVSGARFALGAPVISNTKMILNLGANYYESRFDLEESASNPSWNFPAKKLLGEGLRTMGLNATLFKPIDNKQFIITLVSADWSGSFTWSTLKDRLPGPTWTLAALYGQKPSDNFMWAIGATQSWRIGEKTYFPLLMLNKTFNDHWGLEILLPARAHVRYNFSARSLLLAGVELEGNSYRIDWQKSNVDTLPGQIELRRSEAKPRLVYERQLAGFLWLSAQVGYRITTNFNLSKSRKDGRGEYKYEEQKLGKGIGNALYFNVSLNLVSP